jgi:ATP-dependent helicase YprA (DUF1998 family)
MSAPPSRPTTPVHNTHETITSALQESPRPHKSPWRAPEAPVQPKGSAPTPWPRCRRVVSEKQVAEAILAHFEQVPRDWQLEAGLRMLRGEDLMLVARTAAGKSMVFKIVAMAARLAGLHGCVIVICPLKEVEKDQVRKRVYRMQMCTHEVLHE